MRVTISTPALCRGATPPCTSAKSRRTCANTQGTSAKLRSTCATPQCTTAKCRSTCVPPECTTAKCRRTSAMPHCTPAKCQRTCAPPECTTAKCRRTCAMSHCTDAQTPGLGARERTTGAPIRSPRAWNGAPGRVSRRTGVRLPRTSFDTAGFGGPRRCLGARFLYMGQFVWPTTRASSRSGPENTPRFDQIETVT